MDEIAELLGATLRMGTPLLALALAEMLAERTGIVNIGLEGMLLLSCLGAVLGSITTGSPLVGALSAILAAAALMLVFGFLTIRHRQDQILAGTGVNLIAAGLSGLLYRRFLSTSGAVVQPPELEPAWLPGLFVFCALAASAVLLRQTRLGLALDAAGQAPEAAEAGGWSVERLRWLALGLGSLLIGCAGVELALVHARTFVEGMSSGRGFIALAIVLFGRQKPAGILLGSLLFGMAGAAQFQLQARGFVEIPYQLLRAIPYLATLALLTLASVRKAQHTAA